MKENGNGRHETCPHDCKHCRAVELGMSGRPLTPAEFMQLSDLVEPSREGRVVWSEETTIASLAVDVAQIAYEDAAREFGDTLRQIEREREKASRMHDDERFARAAELDRAERAARVEFGTASESLRDARRLHRALSLSDSEQHRLDTLRSSQERAAEKQQTRADERKQSRKGVLALLRGS